MNAVFSCFSDGKLGLVIERNNGSIGATGQQKDLFKMVGDHRFCNYRCFQVQRPGNTADFYGFHLCCFGRAITGAVHEWIKFRTQQRIGQHTPKNE